MMRGLFGSEISQIFNTLDIIYLCDRCKKRRSKSRSHFMQFLFCDRSIYYIRKSMKVIGTSYGSINPKLMPTSRII